jgi:hypothetical protein
VSARITDQQLAEGLLAYFSAHLLDNTCGSVIFAFHAASEADGFYTAGRILVQTDDATDPNAPNVKRTLTLDIGDALSAQDYVVT